MNIDIGVVVEGVSLIMEVVFRFLALALSDDFVVGLLMVTAIAAIVISLVRRI